jgi:hypothetical protein
MDMLAAMELAELCRLALASPSSTRLLDLAVIATLERLAVELERVAVELERVAIELERLAGARNDPVSSAPIALRSASASAPTHAERAGEPQEA